VVRFFSTPSLQLHLLPFFPPLHANNQRPPSANPVSDTENHLQPLAVDPPTPATP
jgi:hypothetical protein